MKKMIAFCALAVLLAGCAAQTHVGSGAGGGHAITKNPSGNPDQEPFDPIGRVFVYDYGENAYQIEFKTDKLTLGSHKRW